MCKDDEYVVFRVLDKIVNIEPWVQYESFGEDRHTIFVSKTPIRVTKRGDEFIYKDKKGEQVIDVVTKFDRYSSSYISDSSCDSTVMYYYPTVGPKGLAQSIADATSSNLIVYRGMNRFLYRLKFAFPMPAKEYEKIMSGISRFAKRVSISKYVKLSENEKTAKKQLRRIGIVEELVNQTTKKTTETERQQ